MQNEERLRWLSGYSILWSRRGLRRMSDVDGLHDGKRARLQQQQHVWILFNDKRLQQVLYNSTLQHWEWRLCPMPDQERLS